MTHPMMTTKADAKDLGREKAREIDLSRWDTRFPPEIAHHFAVRAVADGGLPSELRGEYAEAFLKELCSTP